MKILYTAAEAAPIIKIGGLGDVAGSLPKALAQHNVTATLVIPHYAIVDSGKWHVEKLFDFPTHFGTPAADETVTVSHTQLPDSQVDVILLGNEHYLAGGGKNAFEGSVSEVDRFAFFSHAILELFLLEKTTTRASDPALFSAYDIIHSNDWHTSLLPLLYKINKAKGQYSGKDPVFVLTIHNMAYQGVAGLDVLSKLAISENDDEGLKWDGANNDIDLLLEGLIHADVINTVSENYAKEILTPEFCEGLCEILVRRKDRLFGILNGIDYVTWNPEQDTFVDTTYTAATLNEAKTKNRTALQKLVGLPEANLPVIGFVGRMEPKQKGIDLIYSWLAANQQSNFQFVLLATGDKEWEEKFRSLASAQSQSCSVNLKFDEHIAHQMYAGCDFILMPSKFEPGGLPQMISQHYGTLPIVHAVGGLKDTVQDGVTGFSFVDYTLEAMQAKITEALAFFNTDRYYEMARVAMGKDYSWAASAKKYIELYQKAIQLKKS